MKKRVFCLLLSMLLLTGCGGGNAETETTAETAAVREQQTEETETEISDDLPEADYDGYAYRILCDNEYIRFIHVTESTGEAINDAVFDANANVMERFNVKLEQLIPSFRVKKGMAGGEKAGMEGEDGGKGKKKRMPKFPMGMGGMNGMGGFPM